MPVARDLASNIPSQPKPVTGTRNSPYPPGNGAPATRSTRVPGIRHATFHTGNPGDGNVNKSSPGQHFVQNLQEPLFKYEIPGIGYLSNTAWHGSHDISTSRYNVNAGRAKSSLPLDSISLIWKSLRQPSCRNLYYCSTRTRCATCTNPLFVATSWSKPGPLRSRALVSG